MSSRLGPLRLSGAVSIEVQLFKALSSLLFQDKCTYGEHASVRPASPESRISALKATLNPKPKSVYVSGLIYGGLRASMLKLELPPGLGEYAT